jgi:pseudouridylate synthase / pseudouridine kinase
MTLGGVARNMAEACHRVVSREQHSMKDTLLLSPIGSDGFGLLLQDQTHELGMRTDGLLHLEGHRSSVATVLLDGTGDLVTGIADMGITRAFDAQQV